MGTLREEGDLGYLAAGCLKAWALWDGSRQKGGFMRRLIVLLSATATMALAAVASTAAPAAAYGGGATHDMWQVGQFGECHNPRDYGSDPGGFWGGGRFDRLTASVVAPGGGERRGAAPAVGGGPP